MRTGFMSVPPCCPCQPSLPNALHHHHLLLVVATTDLRAMPELSPRRKIIASAAPKHNSGVPGGVKPEVRTMRPNCTSRDSLDISEILRRLYWL
ncbi:hypothetical protein C8T65DRAFT_238505 [Cerioporus squamosus]|nr:hypothetical protein C8T65DRAFT_238505 [Cerioporus squamosus]